MSITRSAQDSLRPPTDYKRRFELELHRRQNLERRVEALALENDALKYRLQTLHERLGAELKRRGITSKTRQANLGLGA